MADILNFGGATPTYHLEAEVSGQRAFAIANHSLKYKVLVTCPGDKQPGSILLFLNIHGPG